MPEADWFDVYRAAGASAPALGHPELQAWRAAIELAGLTDRPEYKALVARLWEDDVYPPSWWRRGEPDRAVQWWTWQRERPGGSIFGQLAAMYRAALKPSDVALDARIAELERLLGEDHA